MHDDTSDSHESEPREPVEVWYTGDLSAQRKVDITGSDGARMVLDALVRYLADKPAETLRVIAALAKTLPVGDRGRVTAYTRDFFETVAAVPGARLIHVGPIEGCPEHVYGAEVDLDGVTFEGMYGAREPR
jgi:hypothetical protein